MKAIKLILGGIGFLVFSICCLLITYFASWRITDILCMISLPVGLIFVIVGLFTPTENIK